MNPWSVSTLIRGNSERVWTLVLGLASPPPTSLSPSLLSFSSPLVEFVQFGLRMQNVSPLERMNRLYVELQRLHI